MGTGFQTHTGISVSVRQANLSLVLDHLRLNQPTSRSALARLTGLNKTTVSSLIDQLRENGYVREIGYHPQGNSGRRAVLLELNPERGSVIGGEIGVGFISVLTADFCNNIIWQRREDTHPDASQSQVLERTLELLGEASRAAQAVSPQVFGLTLGVPGLVERHDGTVLFAPNLGWHKVPLGTILREAFPAIPTIVDNEANLAALGEHYFGAAQGYNAVIYISAGQGLGGGMVRNGQLVSGVAGLAGEFGHMTMDAQGEPCRCGNRGCWETQVSQWALFRYARKAVSEDGRFSLLAELSGENLDHLTVPIMVEAGKLEDAVTLEAFNLLGHHLGAGIASLVNALNPDLVVLGGILSQAAEFLMPALDQEFRRRALYWTKKSVKVVLAQHGVEAAVMGGVARAHQSVIANPLADGRLLT